LRRHFGQRYYAGRNSAPATVAAWIKDRPSWLEVCHVALPPGEGFEALDPGEAEASTLAEEHGPQVLLLMDEETGRLEAARRSIKTIGTLGVLDDAAARGFVQLEMALERLKLTNFRVSENLLGLIVARDRQRRQRT
jgi:Domain of unknown function (DUF3368)